MTRPIGDTLLVSVGALVTVVLVVAGQYFGGLVLIGALGVASLAGLFAVVRLDVARLTLVVTLAFAFCTAMPEVHVGPVRLRVALLLMATGLSVILGLWRGVPRLPWWITSLAAALVLVTALVVVMPIDPAYLSGRFVSFFYNASETTDVVVNATADNVRLGASYLLSVLGMSLAVVTCAKHFRAAPLWIALAFVGGNALSALVAFTDFLGYTSLGLAFGGCGVPNGRACGFASHPVILTVGTVYATCLAAWLAVQRRWSWFGAGCLLALILGTYASGTRGGVLCVLLAGAISVFVIPQYRRQFHLVALVAATALALIFVLIPSFGREILVKTRLADAPDAAASNIGRLEAMTQGWHDFLESPLFGIGLGSLGQAHNGYIQSMAAGGVILLTAMVALNVAALHAAWRLITTFPMARALAATMLVRFFYELLEGSLVNYSAFVPLALIAGLLAQRDTAPERTESQPATPSPRRSKVRMEPRQ